MIAVRSVALLPTAAITSAIVSDPVGPVGPMTLVPAGQTPADFGPYTIRLLVSHAMSPLLPSTSGGVPATVTIVLPAAPVGPVLPCAPDGPVIDAPAAPVAPATPVGPRCPVASCKPAPQEPDAFGP